MRIPKRAVPLLIFEVITEGRDKILSLTLAAALFFVFFMGVKIDVNTMRIGGLLILLVLMSITYFVHLIDYDEQTIRLRTGTLSVKRSFVNISNINSKVVKQNILQRILRVMSVDVYTLGAKSPSMEIKHITERQFKMLFGDYALKKRDAKPNSIWREMMCIFALPLEMKKALTYASLFALVMVVFGEASSLDEVAFEKMNDSAPEEGLLFSQNLGEMLSGLHISLLDNLSAIFSVPGISLMCLLALNLFFVLNASKVAYTLFEFSKCTFVKSENCLKLSSGLLNRNEFVVSKDSIFKIEIFPNPFMRGWSSARIVSFEGGEKGFIPCLNQEQLDDILLWLGQDKFNVSKAIRPKIFPTLFYGALKTLKAAFLFSLVFLIVGEDQHDIFRNTFAMVYIASFIFILSILKIRRGGFVVGEKSIIIRDTDYFSGWSVINKDKVGSLKLLQNNILRHSNLKLTSSGKSFNVYGTHTSSAQTDFISKNLSYFGK